MPPKTILNVLTQATAFFKQKGLVGPRLDAEVLLAHALGRTRVELYTAFDEPISEVELDKVRAYVRRRARSEPVAYITGEKEFYSRPFCVTSHVLIPRPETEMLVEQAERLVKEKGISPRAILDLGTGSGVLAITLALLFPDSRVDAIDISAEVLSVAKDNANRHGCAERIAFHVLDMTHPSALARLETYDVIVSNPPYLSEKEHAETTLEIRQYEPRAALVAPEEGLYFYRLFFAGLPSLLNGRGVFLAEIGAKQRGAIQSLFDAGLGKKGYTLRFCKDYAGLDRGVIVCPSAT